MTDVPDQVLKNAFVTPPSKPAPPPIQIEEPFKMKRVGRPLRHVKNIPTKQLVFFSKHKEPTFTYEMKIKLPIPDNKIVVQVRAAPLNPVDLKIINAYTSNLNSERGIGREYSGVITHVGKKVKGWSEGDEVCGLYFHPNAYGTLASSIAIDPSVDPLVPKPRGLSFEEAGSWMITFGTAWQILEKAKVKAGASVFINGGASSVGLMAMQILRNYYKVTDIIATCSEFSRDVVTSHGASHVIIYKPTEAGYVPKALKQLVTSGKYEAAELRYDEAEKLWKKHDVVVLGYPEKKFDLIIDCVGGYELVAHCADYLQPSSKGGQYFTTVGDKKFDYRHDLYNAWNPLAVGARPWLGPLWGMSYTRFYFNPSDSKWMQTGRDLLESREVVNVIDSIYDWKDYTKAKKKLQSGHAHGKVVLQVEQF